MLTFPRDPIVEWYLDGWQNITTDVRQGTITITRGRKDEDPKAPPSTCRFVLDDGPEHGDGDYNPRNPLGQWFGQLGRNTPVRVAWRAGSDDFARTVVSGWGTSPTDGPYTDFVSAGTTAGSVSSGQGRHDITSTAAFRASYLDDVHIKNVELRVDVDIDSVSNVTGGDLEPANLLLRGQSTSTYYMLRVVVTTAEAVTLRLMVGSSETLVGPITVPDLTHGGQTLRVAFQADANTFRGKVWKVADPEPLGWHLTHSHGDVHGAGWVGIRSGVGSGNTNTKPVSFRYENLEIRLPRFVGETAKLLPLSEVDHSNQRTQVECAGILRRLSQGAAPLRSPARRLLTDGSLVTLSDYWPLEDNPDETTKGVNLVGGIPMKINISTVGGIKWGAAEGLPSIERGITITPSGITVLFPIRTTNLSSSWTVAWFQKFPGASTFTIDNATATNVVQFTMFNDGTFEFHKFAAPGVDLFTGSVSRWGEDDVWRLMAMSAEDIGGGQVRYRFAIDQLGIGSWGQLVEVDQTTTYTPPTQAYTSGSTSGGNTTPYSYGQIAVFPTPLDDVWIQLSDGMYGNRGEFAGDRFNRLCDEQGISRGMVGYPTVTAKMGAQRPLPLLDLLRECTAADQGTGPYDARGDAALVMRTNRSLIATPPVAVLDYANFEVAPDFGPTDDDAATINDVTAKRPAGGEYRVEQTTGPLNTGDPGTDPDAVGRYDSSVDVNVEHDGLLIDAAGWRVHMGTINEPRYPTISVDLAAPAVASQTDLVTALLDVDVDDPITVTGAQAARIFDDVRQIVRGYTEILDTAYRHQLVFNTTPASAHDGATLDSAAARLAVGESFLDPGMDDNDTTFGVATSTQRNQWTIDPTQFPFDIMVSGERMTVSAIGAHFFNGAFWQQQFTVTRAVNGVAKSHAFGEPVQLAQPIYLVP